MGFVHALIEAPSEDSDKSPNPVLRFLCYERQRREVGQALLAVAEDYLRARLTTPIWAYRSDHRYWFYGFHSTYLSDHLDHVGPQCNLNGR